MFLPFHHGFLCTCLADLALFNLDLHDHGATNGTPFGVTASGQCVFSLLPHVVSLDLSVTDVAEKLLHLVGFGHFQNSSSAFTHDALTAENVQRNSFNKIILKCSHRGSHWKSKSGQQARQLPNYSRGPGLS